MKYRTVYLFLLMISCVVVVRPNILSAQISAQESQSNAPNLIPQQQFLAEIQKRVPQEFLRMTNYEMQKTFNEKVEEAVKQEADSGWQDAILLHEQALWLSTHIHKNKLHLTGNQLIRLISLYRRENRRRDALVAADWSTRIFRKLNSSVKTSDQFELAQARVAAGHLFMDLGEFVAAEAAYQTSYEILKGYLKMFEAERKAKEDNVARATNIFPSRTTVRRSMRSNGLPVVFPAEAASVFIEVCKGLSQYHQAVGNPQRALELMNEAEKLTSHWISQNGLESAEMHSELGQLFLKTRKTNQAHNHLQEALRLHTSPGKQFDAPGSHVKVLTHLATVELRKKNSKQATIFIDQAISLGEKTFGNDHVRTANCYMIKAQINVGQGEVAEAEKYFTSGLQIMERQLSPNHPEVCKMRTIYGQMFAKRNQWQRANAEFDQSMRKLHEMMISAVPGMSDQEQLGFFVTYGVPLLNQNLAHPDDVHQSQLKQIALTWLVNFKGLSNQLIANRIRGASLANSEELSLWQHELRSVQAQLSRYSLVQERENSQIILSTKILKLKAQERTLMKRISENVVQKKLSWLELSEVQNQLSEDAALVFYHAHPESYEETGPNSMVLRAWILNSAGQVITRRLGKLEDIQKKITEVRKKLTNAQNDLVLFGEDRAEQKARQELQALSDLLIKPLDPELSRHKRWIICPDSQLWLVPWSALPITEGKRYAIEQHTIQLIVSSRDLFESTAQNKPLSRPIIVADPDFDQQLDPQLAENQNGNQVKEADNRKPPEPEQPLASSFEELIQAETAKENRGPAKHRFNRLPGSRKEAEFARTSMAKATQQPVQVLLEKEATEAVVKQFVRPSLLTMITHSEFQSLQQKPRLMNPFLRCGLILAGANNPDNQGAEEAARPRTELELIANPIAAIPKDLGEDGILTGLEVLGLELNGTRVVVLSACETGLGDVGTAVGVQGLMQAFRFAGARNVVSSLWKISDQGTVPLMTAFWEEYAKQPDAAKALREAQLKTLFRNPNAKKRRHPFYWASFTVTGVVTPPRP